MLYSVTSTAYVNKPTPQQYWQLPHVELNTHNLTWDPRRGDYENAKATFFDPLVYLNNRGQELESDFYCQLCESQYETNKTNANRQVNLVKCFRVKQS